MLINKNPELREKVFQNIRDTILKPREGVHLSDLYLCTRKAFWRRKGLNPKPTDNLCVLWLTGFAFQAFMFPADKELSILVDGISCTPDVQRGIEVKTTRQSSKKFNFYEMHHWQAQILGYCKALNQLEYDLVVMFVVGDYAPPFPSVDCWHIIATQEEVDANWSMILERRDRLLTAIRDDVPPEPDCAEWEWNYCEAIELCLDTTCYKKYSLKKK